MNNFDYPLGADNSNAPWNQHDPKPIDVNCCVSYCLSKTIPVLVTNYTITEEYDSDIDDEGHSQYAQWTATNFDNTDFEEEFTNDSSALGIPDLLEYLRQLSEEKIERLKDEYSLTTNKETKYTIQQNINQYNAIIQASKDWFIDEMCIIPES